MTTSSHLPLPTSTTPGRREARTGRRHSEPRGCASAAGSRSRADGGNRVTARGGCGVSRPCRCLPRDRREAASTRGASPQDALVEHPRPARSSSRPTSPCASTTSTTRTDLYERALRQHRAQCNRRGPSWPRPARATARASQAGGGSDRGRVRTLPYDHDYVPGAPSAHSAQPTRSKVGSSPPSGSSGAPASTAAPAGSKS